MKQFNLNVKNMLAVMIFLKTKKRLQMSKYINEVRLNQEQSKCL